MAVRTHVFPRVCTHVHTHICTHAYSQICQHAHSHACRHVCTRGLQVTPAQAITYIGHNYMGQNYIGHNYTGDLGAYARDLAEGVSRHAAADCASKYVAEP